jgi:hypothetical protein
MKARSIILILIAAFVLTGLAGCKPVKKRSNMNSQTNRVFSKSTNKNKTACSECLAGLAVPLRDYQVIEDTNYPEVVALDSSKWDSSKLPPRVIELQSKGYVCFPTLPQTGETPQSSKDANSKTTIKMVRWECQQIYHDYRSLQSAEVDKKTGLEKQGFSCQRLSCVDERGEDSYIWFCSK